MRQNNGIKILEQFYWESKPVCPYCKGVNKKKDSGSKFHCNFCNSNYTVTVGTIFHNTRCSIDKWLLAIEIIMGDRWITCRSMADKICVTKDTAQSIIHRIRGNWDECKRLSDFANKVNRSTNNKSMRYG